MSQKERTGIVVSDKMNKTRTVIVERKHVHPLYSKVLRDRKKFYAHDEKNMSKAGDRVLIRETRPLSKLKRWVVVKVADKAK
ncbi:MAG TPA: 30S ribosomal protein S17 [bacterium]|nr:30S ribosomal protein S17 [bacterium]